MRKLRRSVIRSALKVYTQYDHNSVTADSLAESRMVLDHFMKNSTEVAAPPGVLSLDEATQWTKFRSAAISYIPSKPVKPGIRFYVVL